MYRHLPTLWLIAALALAIVIAACPPGSLADDRPAAGDSLVELARKEFARRGAPLSDSEERLFALIESDPDEIDLKPKSCRAECLRWLCSSIDASRRVPHRGVRLSHVTLDGRLDLRFIRIPFPISLWQSEIPGGINLQSAHIPRLDLRGSKTADIDAGSLVTEGDLLLSQDDGDDLAVPFEASERVYLGNARIGGDLGCTNGRFLNHYGAAIDAIGISVKGSVYLGLARVRGQLNFVGATINGILVCSGASLEAPTVDESEGNRAAAAARFDRLKLRGDLFLDRVESIGEIRVVSSEIGGNLDCSASKLTNFEGDVLSVARSTVGGHLFLDEGFRSNGRILLQQSRVAGNFTAEDDVELFNGEDCTLESSRLTVEGDIRFASQFVSHGDMAMTEMNVGRDLVLCDWKPGLMQSIVVKVSRSVVAGDLCWREIPQAERVQLDLEFVTAGALDEEPGSFIRCRAVRLFGLSYHRLSTDGTQALADRLQWLKQHSQNPDGVDFISQPYEAMASALRNVGEEASARAVEVAKEEHTREYLGSAQQNWLWYRLLGPLIGYGYSPLQLFGVAWKVVLLGCLIFWAAHWAGLIVPLKKGDDYCPRFNPLVYSFETFAPLVKLKVAEFWGIDTARPAGRAVRVYLWTHILLGWLIVSVLVAGLAGLIHK